MKKVIFLALLLPGLAAAGGKHSTPEIDVDVDISPTASAGASAGSNANSDASSSSAATSGADANSNSTAVAENAGNNTAVEFNSKSRALALALPPATADPGSTAPCLESKRGVSILGVGWSGRTTINNSCFESLEAQRVFDRCIAVASSYAQLGREDLAITQLEQCGGVAPSEGVDYVTRQELREREDRIVKQMLSK